MPRPTLPLRQSRSLGAATLLAIGVGLVAALAWAAARGILELGPGSLVVAALGGWGIGRAMRQALGPPLLAAVIGAASWLASLLFTWLLAMVILPGSTRTLPERLAATPFLDWLAPQLGLLEVAALIVLVGFATWTARRHAEAAG
jgi:hypothetical protein